MGETYASLSFLVIVQYFVVSHRPPFDGKGKISGYNLFVSAYHGFAQLGDEHIPVPAAFEDFSVFVAEYSGVEAASESDLVLRFRVMLPECLEPTRYRLMTRLQLTNPGRGRQPGYLRRGNFKKTSFIVQGLLL